ncbi:MAG TPA: acyl-CoA dehydrogenase [Ramlibacter sp.]|nr:acyl-CoA dehydrogenase [Ramlibacter sp.]
MFAEAIESILRDHCTPEHVRAIEGGASPQGLLAALEEAGFLDLLAPEDAGGAGAGWSDFHDVVVLCGAWSVPLPLAQTMAARRLVKGDLPAGLVTFAQHLVATDGGLQAPLVPGGRIAGHVLGAEGDRLVLLRAADARAVPTGVHGSLAATLHWPAGAARPVDSAWAAHQLQPLAALLHAGLLAGAMKRAFDLTMDYANQRVQFGKSIGKFQAIQHQLAVMAQQVVAGRMAAEAAFARQGDALALPACAVAKARTSEAAQQVATIAHAVHGAIGVTEEYDLQLSTRRLHEWRVAHGSEAHWHRVLGRLFVDSGDSLAADVARSLL